MIADGFGVGYIIGKDWAAVFISGFEVSCILLKINTSKHLLFSQDQGARPDDFAGKIFEVWKFMRGAIELEVQSN